VLLSRVWGLEFGIGTNVVDVYIGYLRKKVDAPGEPRLIKTVRGAGYALREG
jgi:DNA-binding response OmpR family regulator